MEGSALSAAERAERASALRAARYGLAGALIGALIGGVGSFLGAYVTYKAQEQTHIDDVRRVAYADLVSRARDHQSDRDAAADAAAARDQTTYAKTRAAFIQAGGDLYKASATVYVVSDDARVVDSATDLSRRM
jgi:hypothetical protein